MPKRITLKNFVRQGKASEFVDGIDTYVETNESML